MAIKVLKPKELGEPLGLYSHGMAAPGGELVVVAGQSESTAPDGWREPTLAHRPSRPSRTSARFSPQRAARCAT